MSELSARLMDDLKSAMRSADTTRRDVLRFLRAEIHNVEIARGRALSDDEVLDVVRRQIKQRRDAIEQFERGKRADLAERERAQIGVLQEYLPPRLDYDQVLEIARAVARELGASGPKDMGRVMPVLRERAGNLAEGATLAAAAREALTTRAEAGETA